MNKKTIITILLVLVTMAGQGQTSFDPKEGCLNVIGVTLAQGIGEYGDKCISANYLHEKFINERFTIGPGIGYSHHNNYNFSAIPVFLSTHYFFLDKRLSPFVNLRVGGIALFNAKNVETNEKYSISEEMEGFSLFVSPSVGLKMHITPNIGIMASISDEAYLVNAFDTNKNDYRNKLINSLGINISVFFQIKGW